MRWTVHIGRFRDVPIRVHVTFLLLVVALHLWMVHTVGGRLALLQMGVLLLLFLCVVAHEVAHTVVALRIGVPITGIILYPFGGVARLGRRPSAAEELRIAAAGPSASLGIGLLLVPVAIPSLSAPGLDGIAAVAALLAWANLIVAGFNLLPAFPLDGGRMLRAALAGHIGWARATVWAASAGQVAAFVLLLLGAVVSPWLAVAGVVILPGANRELRLALAVRALEGRTVAELAGEHTLEADTGDTVASVADRARQTPAAAILVLESGVPTGHVPLARLWELARRADARRTPIGGYASGLGSPIPADLPLADALDAIGGDDADERDAAPVVDADSRVVGLVTRAALERTTSLVRHLARRFGGPEK